LGRGPPRRSACSAIGACASRLPNPAPHASLMLLPQLLLLLPACPAAAPVRPTMATTSWPRPLLSLSAALPALLFFSRFLGLPLLLLLLLLLLLCTLLQLPPAPPLPSCPQALAELHASTMPRAGSAGSRGTKAARAQCGRPAGGKASAALRRWTNLRAEGCVQFSPRLEALMCKDANEGPCCHLLHRLPQSVKCTPSHDTGTGTRDAWFGRRATGPRIAWPLTRGAQRALHNQRG